MYGIAELSRMARPLIRTFPGANPAGALRASKSAPGRFVFRFLIFGPAKTNSPGAEWDEQRSPEGQTSGMGFANANRPRGETRFKFAGCRRQLPFRPYTSNENDLRAGKSRLSLLPIIDSECKHEACRFMADITLCVISKSYRLAAMNGLVRFRKIRTKIVTFGVGAAHFAHF
jgi:hypothetical protein